MKKLMFLLVFLPQLINAQKIQTEFEGKTPLLADVFVGVDNFGARYFIQDRSFFKQEGKMLLKHSDLFLGDIGNVSILNPLKILLFYKNSNTAVVLDRNLVDVKQVNFSEIEPFRTAGYVALAGGENLWLFNVDKQILEIWNERRQQNIPHSKPIAGNINGFFSNYNYCWVYTDESLKKFNIYGVLVADFPIEDIEDAVQDDGDVVFLRNEKMYFLPKETSVPLEIELPVIPVEQFHLKDEILYIYHGQFVHHYRLLMPKKD